MKTLYWSKLHQPIRAGDQILLALREFMKYIWVTVAILAIWVSAVLLVLSSRIASPEPFFLFVMIATIALVYTGFKSS